MDFDTPFFRREVVKRHIRRLAERDNLTVVVGAGVGVEVGLPDWTTLVRRLLEYAIGGPEAATTVIGADDQELVEMVLEHEGVMGAATVARAQLKDQFEAALHEALYGRSWPEPVTLENPTRGMGSTETTGSTAEAVAALCRACKDVGHHCEIATTNYDVTLERAISAAIGEDVKPWMKEHNPRAGRVVRHLHGTHVKGEVPKSVVLTEAEYHASGKDGLLSWQEVYLRRRLHESLVVFVGTSLTDFDLLSFLFRYAERDERPVALLVRSRDPARRADVFAPVSELHRRFGELQDRRWKDAQVQVLAADYYSQPKQFLWEVAHHKASPEPMRYGRRLNQWFKDATGGLPLSLGDPATFDRAQHRGQQLAAGWLDAVHDLVRDAGHSVQDGERLAIHLWCRSPARLELGRVRNVELSSMAMIVCSDRVWRTPGAIDTRRVMLPTRRAAIETFCSGRVMQDVTAGGHQWNYVLAIPIVLGRSRGFERLPVGAITLESTAADGVLRQMSQDAPKKLQDVVDYLQGVGDLFLSSSN